MWRNVHILVLCLGAASALGERARTSNLKERTWVFHLTGNWTYANSAADRVPGAVYSQAFSNPIVGAAGLGREVWQNLYLGFRYEYWFANRKYVLGGVETRDRLDQQPDAAHPARKGVFSGAIGFATGGVGGFRRRGGPLFAGRA